MKEQIIEFIKAQIIVLMNNEHKAHYEYQEARAQGAQDALEDVLTFIQSIKDKE